uniref:ATP synthase F0 subunit 8 n=1 Tax=Quasilineus sinicus TaxID=2859485 RepID=A0A8F5P460_9BILA|nr:ATP synthase F0 subunit 8 [Quasilineus sinicus]QXO02046.1 ATP synthase F0 subunit 8 [Quasilineus sinicus]
MPQLAPLMWMFLPIVLFLLLGVLYCCIWWSKKVCVVLPTAVAKERLDMRMFFWFW